MHTSAHAYTPAYTATYIHTRLIRLRQSLQLNWAFLKALIGPFWPNYHTLIQINPNVSSKYTERAIPKWMLFAFSPFSSLFYNNKMCSSIAQQLFWRAPHTDFKILKSFSFRGPSRREKKINLQMASINLLLGLCAKYQTRF